MSRSIQTPQNETEAQLMGYRLATAHILYHMPDHPKLLQTFIWQQYDIAPQYPMLRKFLDFWTKNIEGRLHSVSVAGKDLVEDARWRGVSQFRIH